MSGALRFGVSKWETLARLAIAASLLGAASGLASAAFLWLLEWVTNFRGRHHSLVLALPLAGFLWAVVQKRVGGYASSHQIIDTVVDVRVGRNASAIAFSTAWLALLGSVWTHLVGGSAGREGTGVQMATTFAERLAQRSDATRAMRKELLVAGVAAGFASIFGTPMAGLLFAFEVSCRSWRDPVPRLRALFAATVAALVGDAVTRASGIEHTRFPRVPTLAFESRSLFLIVFFAVVLGACANLFLRARHALTSFSAARIPDPRLRMAAGGAALVLLWWLMQTDAYLGLGVPEIVRAFDDPNVPRAAFLWKMIFTIVTLSAGFLGGEVTPLFFVGASLGNAFAGVFDLPLAPLVALGLVGVFGAAARTPLALTVMAGELFGLSIAPLALPLLLLASGIQGRWGLYRDAPTQDRNSPGQSSQVSH